MQIKNEISRHIDKKGLYKKTWNQQVSVRMWGKTLGKKEPWICHLSYGKWYKETQ